MKPSRFIPLAVSACALFLPLFADAQTRTDDPSANITGQSIVPAAVAESWAYFIGEWEVSGMINSEPVTGTAKYEWAAGTNCYIAQQVWNVGHDGRTIHLAMIGGWDAERQETIELGFSSSGESATARYKPFDVKTGISTGHVDGANGVGRHWSVDASIERESPDEFVLTSTVDGTVVHSMTYTRSKKSQ